MDYYSGFVFYLNEGNQKWKEYYDSLGKKSFGVFSVAQYFTKKLREMAGERIDRVLQEDSTVMSSLSDNSLELCKKAIKGWDGMYNDLLQQGEVCIIAIPGYLWAHYSYLSNGFLVRKRTE